MAKSETQENEVVSTIGKRVTFQSDTFDAIDNLSQSTGLDYGEIINVLFKALDSVPEEVVIKAFQDEMEASHQRKLSSIPNLLKK